MFSANHFLAIAALAALLLTPSEATSQAADSIYSHVEWQTVRRDSLTVKHARIDIDQVESVLNHLTRGKKTLEKFFGATFPNEFTVRLYPSRADMDLAWAREWGMPGLESQCWMVASGIGSSLSILSPRVWKKKHVNTTRRIARMCLT